MTVCLCHEGLFLICMQIVQQLLHVCVLPINNGDIQHVCWVKCVIACANMAAVFGSSTLDCSPGCLMPDAMH